LDPRRAARAPSRGGSWFRGGWWVIAVALMGLSRLFGSLSSSTPSTPSYDSSRISETRRPPSDKFRAPIQSLKDLKENAIHHAQEVREHAHDQMGGRDAGDTRWRGMKETAKDAKDAKDALESGDCVRARALARDIGAHASPDAGSAADDIGTIQSMWLAQAVSDYCD